MKKLFIFLILFLGVNILSFVDVNAKSFYEGNYIDNIYITKEKGGTKFYQKARFFNQTGSSQFSYCIEPFAMFNENSEYVSSITADNLNDYQMDRIKKIIYFGYQYQNHTDPKWYAITQYLVWKESDPTGNYYFTNGLNGARIDAFTNEINEIYSLINTYEQIPSFNNQTISLVEGQDITLNDTNGVLNGFKSDNNNATILNNQLVIKGLKKGEYQINLTREEKNHNRIPLFFNSSNSQNMVIVGDLDIMNSKLYVKVLNTNLTITKIDSDTKTTIPSGEASLEGAIYDLFNDKKEKIAELVIGKDMTASIENLQFGTYYIKEQKPGNGYLLDDKIYEIVISEESPTVEISLENKVIEKEVEIHKQYGNNNNFSNEEGVSFEIYNKNNNLVNTITTNKDGKASITLPFGEYKIVQRNTLDGYTINDEQNINIENNEKLQLKLYDYKVKVPNTYHSESISYLIILIIGILYAKKMVFI